MNKLLKISSILLSLLVSVSCGSSTLTTSDKESNTILDSTISDTTNSSTSDTTSDLESQYKKGVISFKNIADENARIESLNDSNFELDGVTLNSIGFENLFGSSSFSELRFSSGSGAGLLNLKINEFKIKSIKLRASSYGSDSPSIKVKVNEIEKSETLTSSNELFMLFDDVIANEIEISSEKKNRFYLTSIIINDGETIDPNPDTSLPDTSIPDEDTSKPSIDEDTNKVIINNVVNGNVTSSLKEGNVGDKVTLNVKPNEGFKLNYIALNGNKDKINKVNEEEYYFSLEKGINEVVVTFKSNIEGEGKFDYLYANDNVSPERKDGTIEDYYEPCRGKVGEELKKALHDIIDDHTSYSYSSSTSDKLVRIDRNPLISGELYRMYEGFKRTSSVSSKEHVWAKSQGEGSTFEKREPMYGDMHNLRPCDSGINSRRNHYHFNNLDGFSNVIDDKGNKIYRSNTLPFDGYYEPIDLSKGDAARVMFYMATRYEGDNSYEDDLELGTLDSYPSNLNDFRDDSYGFHGDINAIYEWATSGIDPVSDHEVSRNNICDSEYQHNRNPFIDHPEFIIMIYDKNYKGSGALNDR